MNRSPLPPIDDEPRRRAAALLDELRAHPEWSEPRRAAQLDRLVGGFLPAVLLQVVRERFHRLDGSDGEAILRIVEAMGDFPAREALAEALANQPGLAADRTWDALGVLEGTGLIESSPDLLERRTDLEELLGDDETLDELAAEIDSDPESTWLALQGLSDIEPEIRVEIVAGLAEGPLGPGVVALLRLLAFAHDPATRDAALSGLAGSIHDRDDVRMCWASIATEHHDASIRNLAREVLGDQYEAAVQAWQSVGSGRPDPRITSSSVSDLDAWGVGLILVVAEDGGLPLAASFRCDVIRGIIEVVGDVGGTLESVGAFVAQVRGESGRGWVEDQDQLTFGLLAGSLLLSGPIAPPSLAFWLEKTVGPGFAPRPIFRSDLFRSGRDPETRTTQARAVLDALPDWRLLSPLTSDLAESIRLRDGDVSPDPKRDPAAYRLLFESELLNHLERFRRMLLWMECVWSGSGQDRLARSAGSLADDLADPQHAVPGYPFIEQLLSRSLTRPGGMVAPLPRSS